MSQEELPTFDRSMADEESPPEYSLHTLSDAVQCSELHVQSLRRFLQFRLLVDYDWIFEATSILLGDDFACFTALAQMCFYKPGLFDIRDLRYTGDVACKDAVVNSRLLLPAKALGIPGSAALTALQMFALSMSYERPGYKSPLQILGYAHGMNLIATKLCFDREQLIPRMFCGSQDLRRKALVGVEHYGGRWFRSLESPQHFRLKPYGSYIQSRARAFRGDGCDGWIGRRIHERAIRRGCRLAGWITLTSHHQVDQSFTGMVHRLFSKWRPSFFFEDATSPGDLTAWYLLCRISSLFPDSPIILCNDLSTISKQ